MFHSKLSNEAAEDCIPRWTDLEDFQTDSGETFYECWLDGYYAGDHYKITLEQKLLIHEFDSKEAST